KKSVVNDFTFGDNIITAITFGINTAASAKSSKSHNCCAAPNAPTIIESTYIVFITQPAVSPNKNSAILDPWQITTTTVENTKHIIEIETVILPNWPKEVSNTLAVSAADCCF